MVVELTEAGGSSPRSLNLFEVCVKGLPLNLKVGKVLRDKGMPSNAENLRQKHVESSKLGNLSPGACKGFLDMWAQMV